jgi:hypothetical protein
MYPNGLLVLTLTLAGRHGSNQLDACDGARALGTGAWLMVKKLLKRRADKLD